MADKSHGNAVANETSDRLNALQDAINTVNTDVANISEPSNTIFTGSEVAEADMDPGYVYIWPDESGDLVVGGLDETDGSRTLINLEVSAGSDGGLVGGIVGGLF